MIDNYLDWVKRQRKYHIQRSVHMGREYRNASSLWHQGFAEGCAMTHDFSGQMLKRLQKDIEARHKNNEHICSSGLSTDYIYDVLS